MSLDMLNSHDVDGIDGKKPLKLENLDEYRNRKVQLQSYIKSIKVFTKVSVTNTGRISNSKKSSKIQNIPLHRGPIPSQFSRNISSIEKKPVMYSAIKTGFIGIYCGLEAAYELGSYLLKTCPKKFDCFMVHRISQDHLEQLFGAVRSRSGYNLRPTSRQFVSSYKSLLLDAEIKIANGNTQLLNFIPILNSTTKITKIHEINDDAENGDQELGFESSGLNLDIVFLNGYHRSDLKTEVVNNAIGLICGTIIKPIANNVHCVECVNALKSEYSGCHLSAMNLAFNKNTNLSEIPSGDLVDICITTNNFVDALLKKTGQITITQKQFEAAKQDVLKMLSIDQLFPYLASHNDYHKLNLIQEIICQFLKFKKFSLLKNYNNEKSNTLERK